MVAACVFLLLGTPAPIAAGVDMVRVVPLSIGRGPAFARATRDGSIYVAESDGARVLSYSLLGDHIWEASPGAGWERRRLIGLDADSGGRVFVLEVSFGEVHVLDGATGRSMKRIVLGDDVGIDGLLGSGALAADGDGGFFVLSHRVSMLPAQPIHHFDSSGRWKHSFGTAAEYPTRTAAQAAWAPGWIGRAPDGSLYYRPGGSIRFHRFSHDGQELGMIAPSIPLVVGSPPTGDSVFGTDVLPDGRIVCEVVHRTSGGTGTAGARRVLLDRRLYVIKPDGTLDLVLPLPLLRELGAFVGAGVDGHLWFARTGELLMPGQGPELQEVAVHALLSNAADHDPSLK